MTKFQEQVMLPGLGPFGLGFEGSVEVCQRERKREAEEEPF